MQKKIFSLFLSLLVVSALAALAQSPTTSAPPGNNSTQEPYGATLDHPNPNSGSSTATTPAPTAPVNAPAPSDSAMNNSNSSTSSTTTTSSNASPTVADSTPSTTPDSTPPATADTNSTLPRTASDLPLLSVLALMALGGALLVRTVATRTTSAR